MLGQDRKSCGYIEVLGKNKAMKAYGLDALRNNGSRYYHKIINNGREPMKSLQNTIKRYCW